LKNCQAKATRGRILPSGGELSPHVDDFLRNSKSEKDFIKNVLNFEKDFKDDRGFKGGKVSKPASKYSQNRSESTFGKIKEGINLTDIVKLAKAQNKGNLDMFQFTKPFNVMTKTGITKVTPVPITTMDKGKFVKQIHFKVQGKQFVKLSGVVKLLGITEEISESKKIKKEQAPQKRKNRWLELKNDDTMHANKKLSVGLRELRNQLSEVEKFLGWYNKIKGINELDSDSYWKRTNTNIHKIKERIINIARTLQEIEK